MSIERPCWRNRKELLWSGYYPKWYGERSAVETAPSEEVVLETELAAAIQPEEHLVLPALFILVRQEAEHEQLV